MAVGIAFGLAGGVVAAIGGGVRAWVGIAVYAGAAVFALRSVVGPDLDGAPVGWLIAYASIALVGATVVVLAVRLLLCGDMLHPVPIRKRKPAATGFNPASQAPAASQGSPTVEERRKARQYANYRRVESA